MDRRGGLFHSGKTPTGGADVRSVPAKRPPADYFL
ncbi:hypothetical protein HHX47_DHR1001663 [Lentinula edodes]|nr:hypothetical protein HHX47_DHR1001663 [Lentinula edodes]